MFNFAPTAPLLTRAAMFCACGYPGCRVTLLERFGVDRALARREIGELLALDFDRLVMAHGEVIETGGRQALAAAWDWLGARLTAGSLIGIGELCALGAPMAWSAAVILYRRTEASSTAMNLFKNGFAVVLLSATLLALGTGWPAERDAESWRGSC